jgi:hypothetical protein
MSPIGWLRSGALAGGLAALAGCGIVDAMNRDLAGGNSPPPAQHAPLSSPASASPPGEVAKSTPAPLPEAKPEPPGRLVGMSPDEARALLGAPADQRSDPPAVVWTWRNNRCQLELFFYMDVSDRNLRALTYEVTGGGQRLSTCLGELSKGSVSGGTARR